MATTTVAHDAFSAFYSGDHSRCGQLLEQIGTYKGSYDVKVSHNALLNDYYKSGCADPQDMLTKLTQAYDRARERDSKKAHKKNVKKEEEEEETYREDEDLSILRFNQAILCMQLRQHAQAAIILEELFDNIEPIDDFLAIKICFTLLELSLVDREPEQAVAVLNYLEKPNAFLTVLQRERNAKGAVEPRADDGADGEDGKKGDGDDAGDEGDEASSTAELKGAHSRSGPADAHADGEATSNDPLPSLTLGAFLPRHGRAPDTISRAEYRFFCSMYRARLAAALRNTKVAKKEVKGATEILDQELRHAPILSHHAHTTGNLGARGGDILRHALKSQHSAMIMVVKAYLEYSRQNVRKAMKLLAMCQFNFAETRLSNGSIDEDRAETRKSKDDAKKKKGEDEDDGEDVVPTDFHPAQDEACKPVFFNNLGCIHFLMQKPTLATFYFQKALQGSPGSSSPTAGEDRHSNYLGGKVGLTLPGVSATKHWLDRRAEICYNAGLQMLMSEKPAQAMKCFEQCIPVFRHWPRLWLRIGECCIEMHRQTLLRSARAAEEAPEAEATSAGASNAPAASSRRSASRSIDATADAMGGGRHLAWSIQGAGKHRRWLLTTVRAPTIGRRAPGDGEEADAATPAGGREEALYSTPEGLLSKAGMALRNVLSLVAATLPDRDGATSLAVPVGGEAAAEDAPAPPAATGRGAQQGQAQAQGAQAQGGAQGSGLRSSKAAATNGATQNGCRAQAREMLEAEASLLEDAALVKLSYVSLCQHDHASALRHTRRVLEKNLLLPQTSRSQGSDEAKGEEDLFSGRTIWTLQIQNLPQIGKEMFQRPRSPASAGCVTTAVMYCTEALLLSGKSSEARALIGSFVAGNGAPFAAEFQNNAFSDLERVAGAHVIGLRASQARAAEGAANAEGRTACGGVSASTSMGGFTPAHHVLASAGSQAIQAMKEREGKAEGDKDKAAGAKESTASLVMFPSTEFPRVGEMQSMLYSNLAAVHLQDGNLREAERCCQKAFEAQPESLAPLRTLVYILLRQHKHTQALEWLKRGRSCATAQVAADS